MSRALTWLEDALLLVSCTCVLSIVGITTADVVARGVFNAPFAWSHDLITQYLLVATFFLSLPYVTRIGGHMALDFLARKISKPTIRAILVLIGETLALLFVVGFIVGAAGTVKDAFDAGDILPGDLGWPTWPSRLLGPLGAFVLGIRLVVRIFETLSALWCGTVPKFIEQGGH